MIYRVLRGGSYRSVTWDLRTSDRFWLQPERRDWYFGFRLVVRRAA